MMTLVKGGGGHVHDRVRRAEAAQRSFQVAAFAQLPSFNHGAMQVRQHTCAIPPRAKGRRARTCPVIDLPTVGGTHGRRRFHIRIEPALLAHGSSKWLGVRQAHSKHGSLDEEQSWEIGTYSALLLVIEAVQEPLASASM